MGQNSFSNYPMLAGKLKLKCPCLKISKVEKHWSRQCQYKMSHDWHKRRFSEVMKWKLHTTNFQAARLRKLICLNWRNVPPSPVSPHLKPSCCPNSPVEKTPGRGNLMNIIGNLWFLSGEFLAGLYASFARTIYSSLPIFGGRAGVACFTT